MATLPGNMKGRDPYRYKQTTPYLDEILEETLRQKTTSPSMYAAEAYGGNFPAMSLLSDYLTGARKRQAREEKQIATSDEATARSLVMQLIQDKGVNISPSGDITRGAEPTDVTNMTMQDAINNPQLLTTEALAGTGQEPVKYRFGPEKDPNWWERNVLGAQLRGEETDNMYDIMGKANIPIKDQLALMEMRKPTGEDEYTYEQIEVDGVFLELKKNKAGQVVERRVIDDFAPSRAQGNFTFTIKNDAGELVSKKVAGFRRKGELYLHINGQAVKASTIPGIQNIQEDKVQKVETKNVTGEADKKWYEKIGGNAADRYNTHITQGWSATNSINKINTMLTVLSRTDVGPTTPTVDFLSNFARDLGINIDPTQAANRDWLTAQINEQILGEVKRLTGPISEKELKFLSKLAPTLLRTKRGAQSLLVYRKFLYAKQAAFRDYVLEKSGGKIPSAEQYLKFEGDFQNSDIGKKSLVKWLEDTIDEESDQFALRMDPNSPFYEEGYDDIAYKRDRKWLLTKKYNRDHLLKMWNEGDY